MSFSPFTAAAYSNDGRTSAASLADSSYAERIATPTFSKGLPHPPTLTSPLTSAVRQPNYDGIGHTRALAANASRNSSALHSGSVGNNAAEAGTASLNHSFSHPPLGHPLDEEERRCVNTAFHISFHGNPRVKHKPTSVLLPNGVAFLIVDRFVSGNSDGVYDKNRKMWEQIPVGQARVFARSLPHLESVHVNSQGGESTMENEENAAAAAAHRRPTPLLRAAATPSQPSLLSSNTAVPGAAVHTPTVRSSPSVATINDWTCVATAVGLRKMGHWREATSVFAMHKAAAKSAIALEKIDGESGQVAAFTWQGERYWVVGCRYQHIVTRLEVPETDLVRYATAASSSSGSGGSSSTNSSSSVMADSTYSHASPAGSPTTLLDSHQQQQRHRHHDRTQSSSATALTSGGLSSDAGYLDLAVRMARLWRRVLESLPPASEATSCDTDTKERSAVVALHRRVTADRRTLCFDAILTGWERLQTFSAYDAWTASATVADISSTATGTATPASSAGSPRTTLPASSTLFPSPSLSGSAAEVEVPLWFYAVTWDASLEGRGWCMPVHRALDFFAAMSLPCVPASEAVALGSPAYEALRQAVLSRGDTAGAVLYGSSVDVDDSDEEKDGAVVVQVWKCRSYPHTLERVVQEYVVTHRLCGDPLRNKMKKKVSSLSRETRLYIKQWEVHRLPFLVDFALWLHREKYITPSTDLTALKHIRGHWLSYQERFKDVLLARLQRQQQRLSARPSSLSTLDVSRKEERAGEEAAEDANSDAADDAEDSVDPIMLVGPQGCGKSTMARILYALLEEAGAAPRWLNQDEVGTRSAYLAAIKRAMTRGTYSHLLLDKMNLDDKARADYGEIGVTPVLVVAWRHTSGTEAMVRACYDRVVQRGACHRTFYHGDTNLSASSRSPELRPSLTPPAEGAGGGGSVAASPLSAGSSVPASWLSSAAAAAADTAAPSPATVSALSPTPSSLRLQGILEASARKYQTPSTLPCVELDVTWGCARAVEVVWEALRERGSCELPPLSDLHVDDALQSAYAYERLLEAYPTRVATAILRGPSCDDVLRQLGPCRPAVIPKTQRLQPQVEVLLHDFQLNPSPTALVRYADQVGTTRRLTVQAVVANTKVVLLLVLGPSENEAAISGPSVLSSPPPLSAATGDAAAAEALEDCLEVPVQQEQWAVVAKAKKVTADYCESLAQRVRDDPDEDPYCAVQWLSPPLVMDFVVAFTFL